MKHWWINNKIFVYVGVLFAAFIGLFVAEHIQWSNYKRVHQCQEFTRAADTRIVEYDKNGHRTERTERGKIGYRCNNNTTHWR